jgi:phytoene/squalene synthetase
MPANPAAENRKQLYAALRDLADVVSAADLPEFLAEIEQAKWTAQLRVAAVRPPATGEREPLLTAEQVAARLQVSEAQVYRLAKTALRSAAVEVGPGTLRFHPDRLARFIEARRRGG